MMGAVSRDSLSGMVRLEDFDHFKQEGRAYLPVQYMRARSVRYQVLVPAPGTITRGPFYCNTRHKGLSHIRTCTTQRSTILKNEQMTTGLFVVQLITMLFSNLTASKVNSSVDNPQPHPKFFK
jgi:hypothetical protein